MAGSETSAGDITVRTWCGRVSVFSVVAFIVALSTAKIEYDRADDLQRKVDGLNGDAASLRTQLADQTRIASGGASARERELSTQLRNITSQLNGERARGVAVANAAAANRLVQSQVDKLWYRIASDQEVLQAVRARQALSGGGQVGALAQIEVDDAQNRLTSDRQLLSATLRGLTCVSPTGPSRLDQTGTAAAD